MKNVQRRHTQCHHRSESFDLIREAMEAFLEEVVLEQRPEERRKFRFREQSRVSIPQAGNDTIKGQ